MRWRDETLIDEKAWRTSRLRLEIDPGFWDARVYPETGYESLD